MYREFVIPVSRTKINKKTLEKKKQTWFKCLYCSREYLDEKKAKECLDKHDLILVPIAKNDLGRLNQFLYLKQDELLTESLVRILQKYARKVK
jgi:hypothetical protein